MMQPSVSYLQNSMMPIIDAANTLLQDKTHEQLAPTHTYLSTSLIQLCRTVYDIKWRHTTTYKLHTNYIRVLCVWHKYVNKQFNQYIHLSPSLYFLITCKDPLHLSLFLCLCQSFHFPQHSRFCAVRKGLTSAQERIKSSWRDVMLEPLGEALWSHIFSAEWSQLRRQSNLRLHDDMITWWWWWWAWWWW